MYSYDQFDEETKKYLNKVMDIYSTIKDKDISCKIEKWGEPLVLQFKKLDKKVLALFIAGFLVDGNLKKILEEYDDIKLEDLFSYASITEEEIHKIDDSEYPQFYDDYIKFDLMNIIEQEFIGKKITITPEVIVSSLYYICNKGIMVLDYFGEKYNIKINGHPLFKTLKNYILDKDPTKKEQSTMDRRRSFSTIFNSMPLFHNTASVNLFDIDNIVEQKSEKEDNKFAGEHVWKLLDEIQKKFIGQESATENLFYNIVNNQELALNNEVIDGQRSIMFVDGPTGTGKTAITREITEKLDVPFVSTSITNYSAAGYKGGDFTDILEDLYKKSNGDLEKAQRGIVVLDEFGKIISSENNSLEMKRAVQQQLLDFLGGGKYTLHVGKSIFDMTTVEFDTSKLTFVCLEALTNLRDKKTETRYLGFGDSNVSNAVEEYSITPQDLIDIGFERELVGRFNTYLHTEEYSKEVLLKILKESTISPLLSFEKWIASKGKKLEIEEGVYEVIADIAYELNTGARSLQTVMNNIRTYFLKEILRGQNEVIYIDVDTVININKGVISRKARM